MKPLVDYSQSHVVTSNRYLGDFMIKTMGKKMHNKLKRAKKRKEEKGRQSQQHNHLM
jgi:hypothetical protein